MKGNLNIDYICFFERLEGGVILIEGKERLACDTEEIDLPGIWKVLVKRKLLIIGVLVVSVICVAGVSLVTPKIYRGNVVLQLGTKGVSIHDFSDIVGRITQDRIKSLLPKTHPFVADMSVFEVKDSDDKLRILVDARDPRNIPDILAEFLGTIKNAPVVLNRTEWEKEMLLKRMEELRGLLSFSKELERTYDSLLRQGRTGDIGFNPIDIKERIYRLRIEYLTEKRKLDNLYDIAYLGTPYIQAEPVKPRLGSNLALAVIFGLLGGVFSAFIFDHFENSRSERGSE
jgi:hypothetical protein